MFVPEFFARTFNLNRSLFYCLTLFMTYCGLTPDTHIYKLLNIGAIYVPGSPLRSQSRAPSRAERVEHTAESLGARGPSARLLQLASGFASRAGRAAMEDFDRRSPPHAVH